MLMFAVAPTIEVLSEAANHVSDDGRSLLPTLPYPAWPAFVGMRDRIVHAFFNVGPNTVWKTVVDDMPVLSTALQAAWQQA